MVITVLVRVINAIQSAGRGTLINEKATDVRRDSKKKEEGKNGKNIKIIAVKDEWGSFAHVCVCLCYVQWGAAELFEYCEHLH